MGYIYCLTSPSGKKYIGQTRRTCRKRMYEHQKYCKSPCLYQAIQKYGFDKFKIETLLEIENEFLDEYERKFIAEHQTLYPNGYNLTSGGCNNIIYSEESRKKMSLKKQGENNHNFGKPKSDETKQKISEMKSGEKHHFYNKTFTVEHKVNLSKSHRKEEDGLPMYMTKVKERPEHYTSDGYAITNHPILKNKYFTSKKLSIEEKYNLALNYLHSTDAVQRLNGSGYFSETENA